MLKVLRVFIQSFKNKKCIVLLNTFCTVCVGSAKAQTATSAQFYCFSCGKEGDPRQQFTICHHVIKNQYFCMTGQSLFGKFLV